MSFEINDTILSQYGVSERIKRLLRGFDELIKPDADIELFYNNVFNILTAQGAGLDIWGVIIGIGRNIQVKSSAPDNTYLGFKGSGQDVFNSSPFYNTSAGTETVTLADNAYRELLLIKQSANISRTDIASLENLLERLYSGRGNFYILETGPMKLRYVFEFYLKPFEESLALRRDLPPKPAGVTYEIYQIKPKQTFGFNGANMNTFNHGVFDPKGIQATYTNANKTF